MQIKSGVTLVTGGASGLGGATSEMIIKNGGKVLIADLNETLGNELVAKLGPNAKFIKCDVKRRR
jgi:NAD(P)-dependent dehydrogenase (short-subunit alcohol dehydrogenase family)